MVHYENEVPVQIEDRCVNAAVNMQQRALFRCGLHRFNNMFTFG
jgi:hypothetical protein